MKIQHYKPGNSRHFIEMVLMYVVASMSYFLTLVSIPSWATCRTKKGHSSLFLDFFNFSITYKTLSVSSSPHFRVYKRTDCWNLNHLLDFEIEQHIDDILTEGAIIDSRLTSRHRKCIYQSFIWNSFICECKQGLTGALKDGPTVKLHRWRNNESSYTVPLVEALVPSTEAALLPSPMFSARILMRTPRSSWPSAI